MTLYGTAHDDYFKPDAYLPAYRTTDGDDVIFAYGGFDYVRGGKGNDYAFLGDGQDTYTWLVGDGTDTVDGGADWDLLEIQDSKGTEHLTVTKVEGKVTVQVGDSQVRTSAVEGIGIRLDAGGDSIVVGSLADTGLQRIGIYLNDTVEANSITSVGESGADVFKLKEESTFTSLKGIGTETNVMNAKNNDTWRINGGAGDDVIDVATALQQRARFVLDGGTGNDILFGSATADLIIGGTGDDLAMMGAGMDVFERGIDDGNDHVDGQSGVDSFILSGTSGSDNIDLRMAPDGKARLTTSGGYANLQNVERLTFIGGAGQDAMTVNELTGTGLTTVIAQLGMSSTASTGDGAQDIVQLNYALQTNIRIVTSQQETLVSNREHTTVVSNADSGLDNLHINGSAQDDIIEASGGAAIMLTLHGGAGNDQIWGSATADTVKGEAGDDYLYLNDGDDKAYWRAGEGWDVIDGGAGFDLLVVQGSPNSDLMTLHQDGANTVFSHGSSGQAGGLFAGVERLEITLHEASGDTLAIGQLIGSQLKEIDIDAGAYAGTADSISIAATEGADTITLLQSGGAITTVGLGTEVKVRNGSSNSTVTYASGAGDDVLDASQVTQAAYSMILSGGAGKDTLIGGTVKETLIGGDGNDVMIWNRGGGSDYFDGGTGNDILRLKSMGGGAPTTVLASKFLAQIVHGNVTLTAKDVEHVELSGDAHGSDQFNFKEFAGSPVASVSINLHGAASRGAVGDGFSDTVSLSGGNAADVLSVLISGKQLVLGGLQATVSVSGAEAGLDFITLDGGAGADRFDLRGMGSSGFRVDIVGGSGNDVVAVGGISAAINVHGFVAGPGAGDQIDLRGITADVLAEDFGTWLAARVTNSGGNAVVDIGSGGTVTLVGIDMGVLDASDFIFG